MPERTSPRAKHPRKLPILVVADLTGEGRALALPKQDLRAGIEPHHLVGRQQLAFEVIAEFLSERAARLAQVVLSACSGSQEVDGLAFEGLRILSGGAEHGVVHCHRDPAIGEHEASIAGSRERTEVVQGS